MQFDKNFEIAVTQPLKLTNENEEAMIRFWVKSLIFSQSLNNNKIRTY